MIAFNNNQNNNDKIAKGLKKLMDAIDNADISDLIEDINPEEYQNTNLTIINDLIYKNLFQENKTVISLMITKNKNNSLDCLIDVIE